jgi:hypothetical protein
LGSFLGAVTTSTIGVGANFIFDAITFLISSILVAQLFRYKSLRPAEIKRKILRIAEREAAPEEEDELRLTENIELENQQVTDTNHESTDVGSDSIMTNENDVPEVAEELINPTIENEPFLKQVLHQIQEFFIGIRFVLRKPFILSLIFVKATGAINWASLDFVFMVSNTVYSLIVNRKCVLKYSNLLV